MAALEQELKGVGDDCKNMEGRLQKEEQNLKMLNTKVRAAWDQDVEWEVPTGREVLEWPYTVGGEGVPPPGPPPPRPRPK